MRFERPQFLAALIAIVLGSITAVLLLIIHVRFAAELPVYLIISGVVGIMLASFLLVNYTVGYFIYNKVKIIFKNIHDLKVGDDKDETEIARSTNLDKVSREVA